MKKPVVLILFNRPEMTQRVFAEIRKYRPNKLLLIADGPRPERDGEAQACAQARSIVDAIDWDCDVLKNFSDENLGCKRRLATGLTWAFDQVEDAIILEDDCVPHPDFFKFCQELLDRYANDERFMIISGDCFVPRPPSYPFSYSISRLPYIWGWASWKRAWKHYDISMKAWPDFRDRGGLEKMGWSPAICRHYRKIFDDTHAGKIDTWDHEWTFSIWNRGGLCIFPEKNLVTNIGFGEDATHTKIKNRFANLPTESLVFPIKHPSALEADLANDLRIQRKHSALMPKVINRLKYAFYVSLPHKKLKPS